MRSDRATQRTSQGKRERKTKEKTRTSEEEIRKDNLNGRAPRTTTQFYMYLNDENEPTKKKTEIIANERQRCRSGRTAVSKRKTDCRLSAGITSQWSSMIDEAYISENVMRLRHLFSFSISYRRQIPTGPTDDDRNAINSRKRRRKREKNNSILWDLELKNIYILNRAETRLGRVCCGDLYSSLIGRRISIDRFWSIDWILSARLALAHIRNGNDRKLESTINFLLRRT